MSTRAVFLDRDGVITAALIRDGRPFSARTVGEITILPGVREALERLRSAGFVLIVVTNQPEIARGGLESTDLDAMHRHLHDSLPIDSIYCCPHDDADNCGCRKPRPGLLLEAADRHRIDLAASYVVGDRWRDIEAGRAAGCISVFIDLGYDEDQPSNPDHVARSLPDATDWIVDQHVVSA
jgi:D-glycero-D-manno-heptose 1,7-bisphosphate phosphatase